METNQFNNLRNAVDELKVAILESMKPVIIPVLSFINKLFYGRN